MGKLQEYYRFFDMFKGKFNNEQKTILEGLEDSLIAEEILPAISESVAPVLGNLRRSLTLVVDYDPVGGITVKTTRGTVVVNEKTAKKYQIPSSNKVVTVTEVAEHNVPTEEDASKPDEQNGDSSKISRGPVVKFEVRLNGQIIEGKDGAGVLAETIRRIRYERVAALNIMFVKGTYNLVDKRERTDKNKRWQRKSGDWFIYINTSNPTKAANLAEIASRLKLDMQITLDGKKYYPIK